MNTKTSPNADLDLCPVLIKLRAEIDTKFDQLAWEFHSKFEHAKLKCLTDIPHIPVKHRRRGSL